MSWDVGGAREQGGRGRQISCGWNLGKGGGGVGVNDGHHQSKA